MEESKGQLASKISGLVKTAEECGWWWPFENAVIITDRPSELHRDQENRLHSTDGAALLYRDGWGVYAVHGVRVPEWIIKNKDLITPAKIEAEANTEIRRIMIEFYGADKYILDSGSSPIAKDTCGILYRKEVAGDEPIVMVRVLNSTPEPDGTMTRDEALSAFHAYTPVVKAGSNVPLKKADPNTRYKAYMLRVPPTITKARQAVAWTFGIAAKDYKPVFES